MPNLKTKTKKFLEKVNKILPGVMELEFKEIYERGIFIEAKTGTAAKKKYSLLDQKGNLIIKGMEKVRRDWSNIARYTQERVLLAILRDKSPAKAIEFVKQTIENLNEEKVNLEDLIIYTQLTKPLKEYEQIGPHVVAARKALQRGKLIGEGSLIAYVITKGFGSISDRAEPAEDAKNYDPDYYIHNQVLPAALRVLSALGYTEQDLLEIREISLEKFMRKRK